MGADPRRLLVGPDAVAGVGPVIDDLYYIALIVIIVASVLLVAVIR